MPPEASPPSGEMIVSVSFRVKAENIEDFKLELSDIIADWIDGTIAAQEGEIKVSKATQ